MTDIYRPVLPSLSLDYQAGTLTNTLTGESATEVYGVVLAYRDDRVLWPSAQNPDPRPECVNGSKFGPCEDCHFQDWGPQGEPPICTDELTVLLWQDEGAQVVTLTARRSQVKTVVRYLDMKAFLGGTLHDQGVTIRMTPEGGLHRLTLLPGLLLDQATQERLGGVAARITATGAFGGLG